MKPGDNVEVNSIWAGSAPGYGEPLRSWSSGYRLLSINGDYVRVERTSGTFAGVPLTYSSKNVRLSFIP